MKLEKQVCSLDLSIRLKKLGVKQESIFSYFTCANGAFELDYNTWLSEEIFPHEYISAFSVAELGEMLPRILTWKDGTYGLQQDFYANGLFNIYYSLNNYAPIDFTDEKEADARARLLIHLIENKLMEVPK